MPADSAPGQGQGRRTVRVSVSEEDHDIITTSAPSSARGERHADAPVFANSFGASPRMVRT